MTSEPQAYGIPRISLAFAFAAAMAVSSLVPSGAAARESVQPGAAAPDFTAKDTNGNDVTLSAFKGKTVVLEWNNPDCPYVKKHYGAGNMQALQREATGKGVVWLTINSGSAGALGHMNGLEAEKYISDRKASPSSYLFDSQGKIGRSFGATVTPHMFVIDPAGKVAYMGGIDDKPTSNQADIKDARNFVREALTAVATGQPVKTASSRPYGCQIKYNEPRS